MADRSIAVKRNADQKSEVESSKLFEMADERDPAIKAAKRDINRHFRFGWLFALFGRSSSKDGYVAIRYEDPKD